ncbi:hypothetical protein A2U01_0005642 [Trifolium medium]|uniref:Transmembrane protein n=1 Tax=Trifolium medium TaxID=97028 RepID=A0A392MCH2_9FABA|nr:hypothetical protein [Trifolium medium]
MVHGSILMKGKNSAKYVEKVPGCYRVSIPLPKLFVAATLALYVAFVMLVLVLIVPEVVGFLCILLKLGPFRLCGCYCALDSGSVSCSVVGASGADVR